MIYSLDRIQHTAILMATALMPHRMRLRLRRQGLSALQQAMLRRADVIFIRHPKTGGTWLRVLLATLYSLKYGTSIRRIFRSDELNLQNRSLPRYLLTHGMASWEGLVADAFLRHAPDLDSKRVIFLARHPGDVAVSWYVQYRLRERAFRRELLEDECGERSDPRRLSQWEFIRHPSLGLPAIIEYHNFWARTLASRDNALVVRYEDMLQDTQGILKQISSHLHEDFSDDQIRAAARFASADNLRRLERAGFFSNPSLRLRNRLNNDTCKVRRARSGGYRDDLDPEQIMWVERLIDSHLDPALGYCSEPFINKHYLQATSAHDSFCSSDDISKGCHGYS